MTGYFKGPKPPAGKVPLPSVLGGPGGIKAPPKPAAKPAVNPPVKPPATRVVTVRQHTRTIAAKQPAVQNTAKAEPATPHSTAKRFYHPLQKGQKPSGYEPVGRRPGRAGIGSPVTSRPYWLATKGPTGDQASQLNAAQVAQAKRAGVQKSVPMKVLDAAVHPLTDLSQQALGTKPFKAKGAISDVANIASSVVSPEKAVGAAGILGLGKVFKGAKVADEAVHAAEDVKAAAKAAGATRSAYRAAQRHGIPIGEIKGTGARETVLLSDVKRAHVERMQPQEQLREGLKGARSQYGREKAARKEEEAARAEHAAEALRTISDPDAALAASGAALRGKYATIDYKGLKELNPTTVKQLMRVAENHQTLGFHDKRTVMSALRAAVDEGRVPRPAELRKIEMVFGKKTAAGLVTHAKQNLGDRIINVLNIPRALQTTVDISGLMRQNLVGGVSHPIIWGKSVPRTFKGMTEAGFESEQQAIKDNPLYHMALQDGVQFTDTGEHATMALHEEGFQSDIAANALDKIPKVPNVIKGSARAYATTGNYMRMALYENRIRIATAAKDASINDPKVRKQIADVINAATGRGTLPGRADHLLPAMNTFLYSPRLMLSRLHYMDPTWYFRLKGPARREAMRGLFALAGSVTGSLYLFSQIPGVKVDWQHPQSPDWGKLKIGNMRVDIAGGFQQYVRLAAELAPAALGGDRTYSTNTGQYTKLGSGYGKPTRLDVGLNFIENKLSPVPGAVVNAARGKDAAGNKVTPQGMAENYLTPLGFQDAYSAFKDKGGGVKGIEWAAGAYGLSALGLGVQDYKAKPSKAKGKAPSYFGGSSSGGGSPYFTPSSRSGGGSSYFAP